MFRGCTGDYGGWSRWSEATSPTTESPAMKSGSGHSEIRLRGCGSGHCNAEDSETQRPGSGCTACSAGGFLLCAGITPGPRSASTPESKVRTGCSSAARPDLCGGRPEPSGAKGRLYRDQCPLSLNANGRNAVPYFDCLRSAIRCKIISDISVSDTTGIQNCVDLYPCH